MQVKSQYLFGPVPSRRFGRSLGVDLTPYKTCCHDCVFCQLGRTNYKTIERKEYIPTDAVLSEIEQWLSSDGQADYITLSGSGEPTLHSGFGKVLEFINANTEIPTVLLTNGAMFSLPEVRESACAANIVKVSLSAWHQASFEWVNRPCPQLSFDQFFKGQKAFRDQFNNQLWMEIFLIPGMNSMPKDVQKIARLTTELAPDRIQLNTAVRPPSEDFVTQLSSERMLELTHLFKPEAEIIAELTRSIPLQLQVTQELILTMLRRRPCTSKQIADGFDVHLNEVLKYLDELMRNHYIRTEVKNNNAYYVAVDKGSPE
jgi:wyosine [tRNA(Phe)-imidazoG37] synthetase (radical SAM superfamily)